MEDTIARNKVEGAIRQGLGLHQISPLHPAMIQLVVLKAFLCRRHSRAGEIDTDNLAAFRAIGRHQVQLVTIATASHQRTTARIGLRPKACLGIARQRVAGRCTKVGLAANGYGRIRVVLVKRLDSV